MGVVAWYLLNAPYLIDFWELEWAPVNNLVVNVEFPLAIRTFLDLMSTINMLYGLKMCRRDQFIRQIHQNIGDKRSFINVIPSIPELEP